MTRPNIVYMHSHDTGRHVSPYGYAVSTPHIQRLAEQGVLFRHAFCSSPTCSPSRASLLTGQSAHATGMLGLAHRGFQLADPGRHWNHTFRQAGYRTALAGVQHVARGDRLGSLGYDEVLIGRELSGAKVAAAAAQYLSRPHDRPFLLDVGFWETHRAFPETPSPDAKYVRAPGPLPDTSEVRSDFAGFLAMVQQLDSAVGAVLDAIDAAGLADRTVVILTTDHGPAFPGMKCNLTDHGIGVMLVMRGPGGLAGGQVIDGMVGHVDLFPTLCELTGAPEPPWLEGRSVMPLVRGEAEEIRDAIFAEVNVHAAYEPMRCVRTRRHKYIQRFGGRDFPVLPNCDHGASKAQWLEAGWAGRRVEREQVFDLLFDPCEQRNVHDEPAYAEQQAALRERLRRWMEQTDDPLCAGGLTLPAGAVLNPEEGVDPVDGETFVLTEPVVMDCHQLEPC